MLTNNDVPSSEKPDQATRKNSSADLCFTVPVKPIAQPRYQISARNGVVRKYIKKRSDGSTHPIFAFKDAVKLYARNAMYPFDKPYSGPVRIEMVFVLPRPSNKIWKTKPMPREKHTKKPDKDNLCKGVMDALTGILFDDDSQVYDSREIKFMASGDEDPHVEIQVWFE